MLSQLHLEILQATRTQLVAEDRSDLSSVKRQGAGDVSFGIDIEAEARIGRVFGGSPEAVVVVAEGLGRKVFPKGARDDAASWIVVIDPLDGTREIMYDKRSAWILSGVAPNLGGATTLADIVWALVTEVPTSRQTTGVVVRADKGCGAWEQVWDLVAGRPVTDFRRLRTSDATSILQGFAPVVRYFPGFHGPLGQFADDLFDSVFRNSARSDALVFDDAYLSTAGQLYLLASGTYRLVLDLRPEVAARRSAQGRELSLCAHPYDLAGIALVATEAGATLVTPDGAPLAYPLDTSTDCAYMAFANEAIQEQVWAAVADALRRLRQP